MFNIDKTIAAIATPLSVGGISVIRISGDNSINIADKVFKSISGKKLKDLPGYNAAYGNIIVNGEIVDNGIALVFRSPKSYTGEDVVEISCHGGVYVTKVILREILGNGARIAEPGEFTKRAFLNGKLSATQAESVIDIINANNEIALKNSISIMNGNLFKKIDDLNNKIISIIAHIEAWIDYPEEDLVDVDYNDILNDVYNIKSELEKLFNSYDLVKLSKDGINTSIVGKPNVGKSSLMNLLAGYSKSIVTNIPGTTRDIIEEQVNIGNVVLNIYDTAGIRETDDKVEKIGVEFAKNKIESSDLILFMIDSSRELSDEDYDIMKYIENSNIIVVINKIDLDCKIDISYFKHKFNNVVEISTANSLGLENLRNTIISLFKLNNIDSNSMIIANERQRDCIKSAINNINLCIENLKLKYTFDAISVSLESVSENLLELTGKNLSDVVLNEIFSKFCVGK